MKTNTLMSLCAMMLGAILMLLATMAFNGTQTVRAESDDDNSKSTDMAGGDFKAVTMLTGSGTEVLVVLREVHNEHPYLAKKFEKALTMAVYSVRSGGGKTGDIYFIGTRQISADMAIPQTPNGLKGSETIDDINEMLTKYRADIKKREAKRKTKKTSKK